MIKFGKVFTWGEINKMYPDSWIKISADTIPYKPQDKVYVYGVITDREEYEKAFIETIEKKDGFSYERTNGPLTRQAHLEWQSIKYNMPFYLSTKQMYAEGDRIVVETELKYKDEE